MKRFSVLEAARPLRDERVARRLLRATDEDKCRHSNERCNRCNDEQHPQQQSKMTTEDESLALDFDPATHPFDQQKTLAPPPFPKHFRLNRLLDGLDVGDALFDAMSVPELLRVRATGQCATGFSVPEWVDRAACRRGQKLHLVRFGVLRSGAKRCPRLTATRHFARICFCAF